MYNIEQRTYAYLRNSCSPNGGLITPDYIAYQKALVLIEQAESKFKENKFDAGFKLLQKASSTDEGLITPVLLDIKYRSQLVMQYNKSEKVFRKCKQEVKGNIQKIINYGKKIQWNKIKFRKRDALLINNAKKDYHEALALKLKIPVYENELSRCKNDISDFKEKLLKRKKQIKKLLNLKLEQKKEKSTLVDEQGKLERINEQLNKKIIELQEQRQKDSENLINNQKKLEKINEQFKKRISELQKKQKTENETSVKKQEELETTNEQLKKEISELKKKQKTENETSVKKQKELETTNEQLKKEILELQKKQISEPKSVAKDNKKSINFEKLMKNARENKLKKSNDEISSLNKEIKVLNSQMLKMAENHRKNIDNFESQILKMTKEHQEKLNGLKYFEMAKNLVGTFSPGKYNNASRQHFFNNNSSEPKNENSHVDEKKTFNRQTM